MSKRSIFWAALALPLAMFGGAQAAPGNSEPLLDFALPPAAIGAAEAGEQRRPERPILLAQATDPRVTALEEQVRELNGKIEELNFLILQMQEQMRKAQEDVDFRLQEIEQRSDAGGGSRPSVGNTDVTLAEPGSESRDPALGKGDRVAGAPPREFGTITFDEKGNATGVTVAEQPPGEAGTLPGVDLPAPPRKAQDNATDDTVVAALPPTDDPNELYRNSYNFILSGDYATAEAGFREHIERFPEDDQAPDAHYWLGEALLGMQQYRSAAEIFLNASRDYPDARKAPDMLLKLGVSLAALNQRDVACATYAEIGKRYKNLSGALAQRVKQEQALAGC